MHFSDQTDLLIYFKMEQTEEKKKKKEEKNGDGKVSFIFRYILGCDFQLKEGRKQVLTPSQL